MPIDFYPDTERSLRTRKNAQEELCLNTVNGFDGPFVCTREKNHRIDSLKEVTPEAGSSFHQEEYEGWIWDNDGGVS